MSFAPNPYRALAHAIDVGDRPLAALLRTRLQSAAPAGPEDVVQRLLRALDLG